MSTSIGFFTVATGDVHYYRIANNLLQSYRRFSTELLPFSILCDRENEYTAAFDQVILMDSPSNSYLDKLSLFDYLPYDTSIFIDADCLAYGNLNELFLHFQNADDFSCVGRVLPLDDKTGWFNYEDLGDLQQHVRYCVGLHGGIYYIRRSSIAKAVFDTAKEIAKDYYTYQFKGKFETPGDEPILALSMAIHNCKPIAHDLRIICCYWEHVNAMRLSTTNGTAYICDTKEKTLLVHWGTRYTRELIYQKQEALLKLIQSNATEPTLFFCNLQYTFSIVVNRIQHFIKRVIHKLKRILHLSP